MSKNSLLEKDFEIDKTKFTRDEYLKYFIAMSLIVLGMMQFLKRNSFLGAFFSIVFIILLIFTVIKLQNNENKLRILYKEKEELIKKLK